MVIDNFIERIIEDNEEIMFGKDNMSNKEFLDLANDCANNYCQCMKVPIDDFHSGKEMFRTIKHFMNNIRNDEVVFKGLYGLDLKRINNFFTEIMQLIEDEEKKTPNFDVNIVCESIINLLILLSSIHFENIAEVTEDYEKVIQGDMTFEDMRRKQLLSILDHGEINLDNVIGICYIYENIEDIKNEIKPVYEKINKMQKKSKKLLSKKGITVSIGTCFAAGFLTYSNPVVGLATTGILFLKHKKDLNNEAKLKAKFDDMCIILCRYQYWKIILTACYNYYCKNYGGGINE